MNTDNTYQGTATVPNQQINFQPAQGMCPCCGYCPHCGRSDPQFQPYYPGYSPIWYYQPTWTGQNIQTSGYIQSVSGTVANN